MAARTFRRIPFLRERPATAPLTATRALTVAFHDTAELLLRPVDASRWLKLSIVCLFLGGGTPSAAFNWSLGALPGDIGLSDLLGRIRQTVGEHVWLIVAVTCAALGLLTGLLYLRSAFRFVLVDSILRREVRFKACLKETRRLGRSYFRWLVSGVLGITLALLAGAMLVYPYFRTAATGMRSAAFWAVLGGVLMVDVLIGLAVALVIVLTDDFVVPLMYAEHVPLLSAWRKLAPKLKSDPWPFAGYVFVRFAVAVATSLATLFLLFPLLLGLFSGAMITAGLVVLGLRVFGSLWSWNPLTISLTAAAFSLLIGLVLMVLSVVGMPAQLLLQDFGIRFISSHFPSVNAILPPPSHDGAEGEAAVSSGFLP